MGRVSIGPYLTRVNLIWKILFCGAIGIGELAFFIIVSGRFFPGPLIPKLYIALFILTIFFFYGCIRYSRSIFKSFKFVPQHFSLMEISCIVLTLFGMTASFLACFSPITYYDSLVYHLGLPNLYRLNGTIEAIPFNMYSFFPANTEMIFLFMLEAFPNPEYVINLFTWLLSMGIGCAIFTWNCRWKKREAAFISMALWWTLPCVLLLSIGGYVEIPLAFFILLSLKSFTLHMKFPEERRWLFISGIMGGLACATKYTGAICPIIISVFLCFDMFKKRSFSLQVLTLYLASVLLPFLPWLIKNMMDVGNPFFPFFYDILGSHSGWTQQTAESYFKMLTEYGDKSRLISDLKDLFFAPWNIPKRFGGGFDVLGNLGWWPLIIWGVPFTIVFSKKKDFVSRILILYLTLHFSFWFLTKPVLRFLMGALPVACSVSSWGIAKVIDNKKRLVKTLGLLLVLPWVLSQFFLFNLVAKELGLYDVSFGHEEKEQFLERKLPFYKTFKFANEALSPTNKIYLLGDQRGYHLRIPFINSSYFSLDPLSQISNEASTDNEIGDFLKKNMVTHIIINQHELIRLGGLESLGYNSLGEKNLVSYLKGKTSIFESGGVTLFQLF